jgi:uncharacterized lipoprotein YehR (DUF1307 family)
MLYTFIEFDGGSSSSTETYEFSTNINGVSVKFTGTRTILQDDDVLSQSVVEYCDNTDGEGYTYNPGKISFRVKQ